MVLSETNNDNSVKLTSARIMPTDYSAYGISEQAESAYTVTAAVQPTSEDANVTVSWSLSFIDSSSSWANGKKPENYVTAKSSCSSAADSKSVTLSCNQAFGEPIYLVASATIKGVGCSATVRVDYQQKLTSASLDFGTVHISDNSAKTVAFIPVHYYEPSTTHGAGGTVTLKYEQSSVYTRAQSISATAKFKLNTDFTDMETYGGNPCYSYTGTDGGEITLTNGTAFYFDTTCNPFKLIRYTSRSGTINFNSGGYDNGFDNCVRAFYSTSRELGTITYTVKGTYETITYTAKIYAEAPPTLTVSNSYVAF